MKKVFLFDFGNVLGSETDILARDKEISERTGLSNKLLLKIFNEYWNFLKIGERDLEDYHQAIADKALKPITANELRELHKEKIWINKNVLELAEELKRKGNRIMILSNESKQGMEDKKNKFLLPDIFERIYNSAKIGIAKPDKKIFEYVINDLSVNPSTITFIDDWDKNILTAKNLGMQAIQYQNLDQLKKELFI